MHGNVVTDNSINGLFVRITTPAGTTKQPLSVSAAWDDADITHVLADRLVVRGTPGGAVLDLNTPPVQVVALTPAAGGLLESGDYSYRVVFVDAAGNEGAPSNATSTVTINAASGNRSVQLNNLPAAATGFVSRRLYRSDKTADPNGPYVLVAELNATAPSYLDTGAVAGTAAGNHRVVRIASATGCAVGNCSGRGREVQRRRHRDDIRSRPVRGGK